MFHKLKYQQVAPIADTENPKFNNCPAGVVSRDLYEPTAMPDLTVTDNDHYLLTVVTDPAGVDLVGPLIQEQTTVTYTATDHNSNAATCVIDLVGLSEYLVRLTMHKEQTQQTIRFVCERIAIELKSMGILDK